MCDLTPDFTANSTIELPICVGRTQADDAVYAVVRRSRNTCMGIKRGYVKTKTRTCTKLAEVGSMGELRTGTIGKRGMQGWLKHHDRPEWRETAEKFIATLKRNIYEPYISDVVLREIDATRDVVLQKKLVDHINAINPIVLQTDEEIEALTDLYMKTGFAAADSIRVYNDYSHVAIATVNGIRHIVSFNCKHLVNDKRIDAFNAINFPGMVDQRHSDSGHTF